MYITSLKGIPKVYRILSHYLKTNLLVQNTLHVYIAGLQS